ncbi:MAG: hypothetical protein KUG82_11760 [Pseudomonadales bacterium]|nr:hypothetical protein [Pseudomonadales bacterium]
MQFREVVAAAVLFFSTSAVALAVSDNTTTPPSGTEESPKIIARSDIEASEYGTTSKIHPTDNIKSDLDYETEIIFSLGSRKGDFDWSIASDFSGEKQPNTLSELSYFDLNITETAIDYQIKKRKGRFTNLYIESHISAGYIEGGSIQDSDYDGDNRSEEFSRSLSNPEGSFTFNLVNAIGIKLNLSETWRFTPLLGYAYNVQSFVIREGEQVLSTARRTPSVGQFSGLDSSYQAQWYGFWLGLISEKNVDKHYFTLRSQFHFPEYYAEADWNLRSDFAHPKSFAHYASGSGISIKINYSYQIGKRLKLNASYHNERWQTRNGIDTIYFEDGDTASTRLNETNWKSSSLSIGIIVTTD